MIFGPEGLDMEAGLPDEVTPTEKNVDDLREVQAVAEEEDETKIEDEVKEDDELMAA